ncbi:NAD(P)-binding protein [Cucurbitaria berberidis CBS 394.84]|uniref:NAD(P)-binding protein n=1 Tax=Cucurbitaria berberidis CBS 394.84 TaxID=1168544 RepID=A0A9P4L5F7_9PLEO|nr:NAD(P)-binding protein [Cucurbitaria berberidis CBS 394.84]KAF1841928.1 NAD(P)-binding protein [Cucurbitaria berberidis CBS 394.84]
MPTVIIHPGTTVFVTGVNGLIGSHIVDQLLKRGYHVRGAVRNVEKNKWLADYFKGRYDAVKLDLVEVPDMTLEGCYDDVLQGIDGFIHVASPLGGFSDADAAIAIGVGGGLNALKACAKTASIKRFGVGALKILFTSSSLAATFPKPDVQFSINKNSYNEEAVEVVRKEPSKKGLFIYAAMKMETEKAIWKWMNDNKPDFVLNTILPNANFGRVLVPAHQGYPSTIDWAHAAWSGEYLKEYTQVIDPQWFISPVDTALLHVSALIYSEVNSERLYGFAEPWNFNQLLAVFRKLYPQKTFPEDVDGLGTDRMSVPNQRAEEVLGWVKGAAWDGLEESLTQMSANWVSQ